MSNFNLKYEKVICAVLLTCLVGATAWAKIDSFLQKDKDLFENPDAFLKLQKGHPNCLYPASLKYLRKQGLVKSANVHCPALEHWKAYHPQDKLAVVFASQYISNPSSAMGHTFLKFIRNDSEDLMNTTIGFLAAIDPKKVNPFSYIYKGLFGEFDGVFDEGYYFTKIREYSHMEARDVWEYELNFTNEEIDLLLDLIWELRLNFKIPYHYTHQNCGSFLLDMLLWVKQKSLTFYSYRTPMDTLIVLNNENLILKEVYRPSLRANMLNSYLDLSPSEKTQVLDSVEKSVLTGPSSVGVDQTILEYLQLEKYKLETYSGDPPKSFKEFENQVLLDRAKLGQRTSLQQTKTPLSPLLGHKTTELAVVANANYYNNNKNSNTGTGNSNSNDLNFGFELAALSHHLLAAAPGFLKNSHLEALRFQFDQSGLTRLKWIEISNRPNFNLLDRPLSWQMLIDYQKEIQANQFHPQGGVTFELLPSLQFYSMASFTMDIKPKGEIGIGFQNGLLFQFEQHLKMHLSEEVLYKHNFTTRTANDVFWNLELRWIRPQGPDLALQLQNTQRHLVNTEESTLGGAPQPQSPKATLKAAWHL